MIKNTKFSILCLVLIIIGAYSIASAEIVDRIVAVVNNDIITLRQLDKATKPYKLNIEASQNSSEQKKQLIETLEKDVLGQLIDRSLTSQEAVKYNIEVTKKEVDGAINYFMKTNKMDQEGFERSLTAEGISYKDYRAKMRGEILQSMLINRAVRSQVIITDTDIKNYYDAHKEEFSGMKKYHLRNILMENKADLRAVEKKLGKNFSFAQLAKKYSIATNASDGGDLGAFELNSFSENIKNSLQSLGKGDHTPILEAGQGYQILFVENLLMEGNKTLKQASDQIENILYKEKAEKRFSEWMDSLKKHAHIVILL
ncbi:MAG: parvulin peptidyl-prolyl isomerase [Desulfobacteraceae bacterium]|nr:parvulin peptidyl-prolyl isomerase [Desulfobacteraceae bacterium]